MREKSVEEGQLGLRTYLMYIVSKFHSVMSNSKLNSATAFFGNPVDLL